MEDTLPDLFEKIRHKEHAKDYNESLCKRQRQRRVNGGISTRHGKKLAEAAAVDDSTLHGSEGGGV